MSVKDHKFPFAIYGEFINLVKLAESDAAFVFGLRKSKAAEFLNCPKDYTYESQVLWQRNRPLDEINYIIYDGSHRVGMISIYDCDWVNGVSNVGRLLLSGQFIHNHRPYGLEALKLCYGYVFEEMGFRKISGTINSKNTKVVSLQLYLGMIQEGFFKSHVLLNGEPQDLFFLSLMKEDFLQYKEKIDKLLDKFKNRETGAYKGD